jgi:hypothetical protein
MAYADQQALSADGEFQNRIWACLTSESAAKDPGSDPLAEYILLDPWQGVKLFMPLLSTAPGFGDKYAQGGQESIADGEILAATQAAWPRVQVPS